MIWRMTKQPSKSRKRIEREIEFAVEHDPIGSSSWGPVTKMDVPPVVGATINVDGRPYSVLPAAIRTTRTAYGEREFARETKRTQDDAWLVLAPDRNSILGLIVGGGRHWSIYRKAGDASSAWRKEEDAEITYRRGVEDDWRSVVSGIAKMTL